MSLTLSREYGTFLTSTMDNVMKQVADNVTTRIPLLYWLSQKGQVRVTHGGAKIFLPVIKEKNSTAQGYNDDDTLNASKQDPVQPAVYEWKQYAVGIFLSGREIRLNRGQAQLLDLLAVNVEQAEISLRELVDEDLHSTASETNLTSMTGLQNIIKSTASTGETGNIDRATNSWWRNQTDSVATGFNTDGLLSMRNLWASCSRGGEHPDFIEMTVATFSNYERSLSADINYNLPLGSAFLDKATNRTLADAGIENLTYKGAAIVPGDNVPAQTAYFINSRYLWLQIHEATNWVNSPFMQPTNQDALIAYIYLMANLVSNNLARQGALTGLPDTWA